MLIEFQISKQKLVSAILNRIRAEKICITDETKFGQSTYLVDHIEIRDDINLTSVDADIVINLGNDSTKDIQGSNLDFNVPVSVYLVTLHDLEVNNTSPTDPAFLPDLTTIHVHFKLSVSIAAGVPVFTVKYDNTELGLFSMMPSDAVNRLSTVLEGFSGDTPFDLLGSLQELLGGDAKFTNAGMAISGDCIAIRIEIGSNKTSVSDWEDFFAGMFQNTLGDQEWSVFIDKMILIEYVKKKIKDKLETNEDLVMRSDPSGSWSPSGQGLRMVLPLTVPDLPPWGKDLDVDVTISCEFLVPASNQLLYRMTWDIDRDNWDMFLLVLGGAFWGALAGLAVSGFNPIGAAVGAVVSATALGVTAGVYEPSLPSESECHDTGDNSRECVFPWPTLRNPLLGTLNLNAVIANTGGLVLGGVISQGTIYGRAQLSVHADNLRWGITGSCSRGFGIACSGGVLLNNEGHAPLAVCEARVLDDPAGQFASNLAVNPPDQNYSGI